MYERLSNRSIERIFRSGGSLPGLIAELDDLSFDWHGALIPRVLRHLAVRVPLQAAGALIRPRRSGGKSD